MAYNSAIDNVYNHYLTTYAPNSSVSKYDTHKKSELRGIYNSMLKLNKDAPLYLLNSAQDSREFAVNLKENARALRNTIASIGGQDDESIFKQKSAYSTDEGMVSAEFIGDIADEKSAPTFSIEVTSLASPQTNLGYALSSDAKVSLPMDTYSFDVNINDLNYEFQFTIRDGDTNKDVQERLARLITNADVGIEADVLENGKGSSALRLTSTSSGLKPGRETIFDVSDDVFSQKLFSFVHNAEPELRQKRLVQRNSLSVRNFVFSVVIVGIIVGRKSIIRGFVVIVIIIGRVFA